MSKVVEIESCVFCPKCDDCRHSKEHGPIPEECPLTVSSVDWIDLNDIKPKSNIFVLLKYKNKYGFERRIIGKWIERFTEEALEDYGEYDEKSDNNYAPEGWYEQTENHDEHSCYGVWKENNPTHWMPLPKFDNGYVMPDISKMPRIVDRRIERYYDLIKKMHGWGNLKALVDSAKPHTRLVDMDKVEEYIRSYAGMLISEDFIKGMKELINE